MSSISYKHTVIAESVLTTLAPYNEIAGMTIDGRPVDLGALQAVLEKRAAERTLARLTNVGVYLDDKIEWVSAKGQKLQQKLTGDGWVARSARWVSRRGLFKVFKRILLSDAERVTYKAVVEVRHKDGTVKRAPIEVVDADLSAKLERASLAHEFLHIMPVPAPPGTGAVIAALGSASMAVGAALSLVFGKHELGIALAKMSFKHFMLGIANLPGLVIPLWGNFISAAVAVKDAQDLDLLCRCSPTLDDVCNLAKYRQPAPA